MLSIFQETNQKRFKTCAKLFFKQTNLRTILVSLRFEIITDCPKFEFKDQLWNNLLRHYIEQKGPAVLFQMIFHKFFINILHTVICDCINRFIIYRNFPDKLKLAEKTPIPKYSSLKIGDYQPISISLTVSKIFEIIYRQLSCFELKFSKYLCGFLKKAFNPTSLLRLLTSWQNRLSKGKAVGNVLMDLSKAYGCLPHDLLVTKLKKNIWSFTVCVC